MIVSSSKRAWPPAVRQNGFSTPSRTHRVTVSGATPLSLATRPGAISFMGEMSALSESPRNEFVNVVAGHAAVASIECAGFVMFFALKHT